MVFPRMPAVGPAARGPRPSRTNRGFSLVEVLVAVIVSAIGFAAVFALQIRTMQGNVSAREQAAAMVLAESAMETLRAESYRWRSPTLPAGVLSEAPLVWHTLSTLGPVDHGGLPLTSGVAPGSELNRQRFCVHYWMERLADDYENVLNVRVRVVWPRGTSDVAGLAEVCAEAGAAAFRGDISRWNTLTLPGALRMRDPE